MAVRCSFFSPSSSDVASLSHSLTPSLSLSLPFPTRTTLLRRRTGSSVKPLVCAAINNPLQYRKLGDSDLNISEITLGTVSFIYFISHIHLFRKYCFFFFVFWNVCGMFLIGWCNVLDDLWGAKYRERIS
jgi:hypothetical protein